MCCETRRPSELRCFAATTHKPINIEVCVVKKKALAQTAWKRNLLTRHKPYKHWTLCFKLDARCLRKMIDLWYWLTISLCLGGHEGERSAIFLMKYPRIDYSYWLTK